MEQTEQDQSSTERRDGLVELDAATILERLRSHNLGRIAYAHDRWPVVVPVNYAFEDPTIVLRVSAGAMLSSAPFHAVAFEVDDADPEGKWGWSVLVQGPAFEITDALDSHSSHLRRLLVVPAAPGDRHRWLAITAVHISGRAFGEVPPDTTS